MIQDAFTQADYAINITDPEGRLLQVNTAYLKLYKFGSEEEVLGLTQRIIRSPLTPDSLYKEMWETISIGIPWRGDLVNKAKDGSDVHVHLTISPIRRDQKIVGYMGFSLDRGQQVMLERQLLHANKLMVLGTLGAGLAHEMNNPLASILLDAEYLKEIHAEPEQVMDHKAALAAAESVIRGVERMRRVLRHLLQYSKIESATELGSSISIQSLIEDSFLFLDRQLMNRGIELQQEVGEDLWVSGSPTELESVLHNLITNARDAFADREGEKYIRISARKASPDRMEIVFEDNAGGIPVDHLDKIFEPFFTTKEGQAGTGLGLSLSRKIIADHGGTIQCESGNGRTRFTIHLPARQPELIIPTY